MSIKSKVREFVHRNERKLDVLFFVGGFIFDMFLIEAPDHLFGIAQQVVYLVLIAALLQYETLYRLHKWRPGPWLRKVWGWRNFVLHFLLGTLLNLYSLFYIKSASFFNSLIFLVLMIGFILANELPIVKGAKVSAKIAMYAICLFSFFAIIYPIVLGFVGVIPFALAIATTLLVFAWQAKRLARSVPDNRTMMRVMVLPVTLVTASFVIFYYLGIIPPVPLSVKEQGVYHMVEKRGGDVLLSYEKTWWKIWQRSDSRFRAAPGDKLYFYAQVYSPTRISDQVVIHWFQKMPNGSWLSSDRITMNVQGGREDGFRGYAIKSNYTLGEWQVRVETSSGLEISRYYFDVVSADPGEERVFTTLVR